ncbi:hypothetical protein POM88_015259 [Heracleum sosnowskyi]|uniref:Uncharacterized protein n=1 Tax=Heracleum sosnowskyi TaxID=360622 RepID=A0AAD8IK86_9APIA|nr:hypothetical protein POM88_015259 [Heracleum sosnowskyi]
MKKISESEDVCRVTHIEPNLNTASGKFIVMIDSGLGDPSCEKENWFEDYNPPRLVSELNDYKLTRQQKEEAKKQERELSWMCNYRSANTAFIFRTRYNGQVKGEMRRLSTGPLIFLPMGKEDIISFSSVCSSELESPFQVDFRKMHLSASDLPQILEEA